MTYASAAIAARLDRLPPSRTIRRLVALLSFGGWFEFYDLFFTAYIAVGLFDSGIFRPTTSGFFDLAGFASFVAALFAGLFLGTLLFSRLSDRFGRRAIFTLSLLWYSAGTLVMAVQTSAAGVDLWRLIASIGIGVELVNIDAYLSELVPKQQRGAAFAYSQFIMFTVVPVVAFIAWLMVPRTILGVAGWRWVVAIGALGAIFVWFIRRALPESPRWLAEHGRLAEAERITAMIEDGVAAETGAALPPPQGIAGAVEGRAGVWREIWSKRYRGRTLMLIVYNFFQTIGYYGFSSWVPTFLVSQGIAVTRSLEYTVLIALAAPAGPLAGLLFADRVERKWQIAGAAAAIAAFGLLFSQQRSAVGIVLFGILVTLANNWLSFAFHAYQAELYPTRIRAQAVGFVYSWSRFSSIFSGFIIAFCLGRYGTTGVFAVIAGAMLVVVLVVGGFGPATSRRSLETIAG